MKNVRIGIIGLGVQGSLYARLLTDKETKIEGLELSCICSSKETLPIEVPDSIKVFKDYKQLLRSGLCDSIVICVPHIMHMKIAEEALRNGIHVLCEKPAAIKASEMKKVKKLLENKDLCFAMMFNNRANPVYEKAHELLQKKELGELRNIRWNIDSFWRPDTYYASASWRGNFQKEGGGILVNQIAHQLDLLLHLGGEPSFVHSSLYEGRYRNIDVENEVYIDLLFKNGASGFLSAKTYDPFGSNLLEIVCSKGKIVIENNASMKIIKLKKDESEMNSSYTFRQLYTLKKEGPASLYDEENIDLSSSSMDHYRKIFCNFANHILYDEPLIASFEDGLRQVEFANSIYESAWKDKTITFPGNEEDYDKLLQNKIEKEIAM